MVPEILMEFKSESVDSFLVLISQLVDEIEMPFQGLPPIFGVEQLNSTIVQYIRHKGSPEIQDGGLQTS